MQAHARLPEFREALWSLAFALWCVAWPAGLVLAGGATPGFLSQHGDSGLRELVEARLPSSYGVALFAWGTLAFAAMLTLLRVRRWLDPHGLSGAAVRWSFSSRSLNLTVIMLALAACLLIGTVQPDSVAIPLGRISPDIARFLVSWWWPILMIALAILSPLLPLCLLNPDTLARDRLERWWRPFWPGFAALMVAVVCWQAMPMLTAFFVDAMPASTPASLEASLQVLEYLLLLACDLIALAWWFSRGRTLDAKALCARFFRWTTLRVYLGFDLLAAAFVLAAGIPVLFMTVFFIYIAPQYVAWQASGHVDMPMAYGALIRWARDIGENMLMFVPVYAAGLFLFIAQGRLLYRRAMAPSAIPDAMHENVDGAGC